MKGHWQREVPSKSGQYWVADYLGNVSGPEVVAYLDGKLVFAGGTNTHSRWGGFWWSEPVVLPPPPDSSILKKDWT